MKGITVIPFNIHHLQVMDIRDAEMKSLFALDNALELVKEFTDGRAEAGTFLYDGRVLCCAGFKEIWTGVLEGWVIPSVWVKTAPISFAKYIKRYVESIAKTFKVHRFQSPAIDDELHERFMTFLGFSKEGTMRQYTHDKKDYCMYARLF